MATAHSTTARNLCVAVTYTDVRIGALERAGETLKRRHLGGGEGGEDKDEGRVGVRSDNRPKHHKQPRRPREEAWMGTRRGALYSLKDFGNLV